MSHSENDLNCDITGVVKNLDEGSTQVLVVVICTCVVQGSGHGLRGFLVTFARLPVQGLRPPFHLTGASGSGKAQEEECLWWIVLVVKSFDLDQLTTWNPWGEGNSTSQTLYSTDGM